MPVHERIQIGLMRICGGLVAVWLGLLAILLILLPSMQSVSLSDKLSSYLQATNYLVVTICLLTPLGLIKKATTAYWFFRVFLVVGGLYALTTLFSRPFPLAFIPGLIVLGNIWLSYRHWQRRLVTSPSIL